MDVELAEGVRDRVWLWVWRGINLFSNIFAEIGRSGVMGLAVAVECAVFSCTEVSEWDGGLIPAMGTKGASGSSRTTGFENSASSPEFCATATPGFEVGVGGRTACKDFTVADITILLSVNREFK